jgi:DNA repair protein RadA/Sms
MLELCRALSDRKVLLVSGEESTGQVRLRADRMQLGGASILVLAETRAEIIADTLRTGSFAAAVVDSVQTLYLSGVSGAPGSVSQVRECAQLLQEHAKSTGTPLLPIGHVSKDGSEAVRRVLEHLVDAVLYTEGDRHHSYRLLRAVKNRFGATNEIGVFELWAGGLRPVANPSGLFLPEHASSQSGSAVACALEGTRPFLVEVQALASETAYPSPQRVSNGVDAKRLQMLVAIIERRTGASLRGHDVFVNVAGGIRLSEPASDAAIAVSILSSVRDVPVRDATMILGEVGLSGEVRPVSHLDTRLKEAERLGFARALLPAGSSGKGVRSGTIELIEAATLSELVERVLS